LRIAKLNDERSHVVSELTFKCPEAYAALRTAIEAGLRIVRQHDKEGKYHLSYFDFPKLEYFDSGLPRISKTSWGSSEGPVNYVHVFQDENAAEKIPEWKAFLEFANTNPTLQKYFDNTPQYRMEVDGAREMCAERVQFSIYYAIKKLIDRYIHVFKSKDFDEARFRPLYSQWENAVFLEYVPFDIVIPLLMITCNFDKLDIGPGLYIEKMSETFHLARSSERRFSAFAHDCVVNAATHALVLEGWCMENTSKFLRQSSLRNIEGFRQVTVRVDNFFAALRSISGVQTGYSQILIRAVGWADSCEADLPHVDVIPIRVFPDHFERGLWLEPPPLLDSDTCKKAGNLFNSLTKLNRKQLVLAARRLNLAMLRNSEEDTVLDITIGLEVLLVADSGRGEITHKLAMRLGAIARMRPFEEYTPKDVFEICKKLYGFRSAIAHGSGDAEERRIIKVQAAKEPIEPIGIGISLLRHVIRFLVDFPEFLDPNKLDMTLLPDE
jgi:hypothetical protein